MESETIFRLDESNVTYLITYDRGVEKPYRLVVMTPLGYRTSRRDESLHALLLKMALLRTDSGISRFTLNKRIDFLNMDFSPLREV
jgi:hypothetical protein